MTWAAWTESQLAAIRADGRWRQPRDLDVRGPAGYIGDRPLVTFASNDYLGLTAHPAVIAAAREALERWGSGAGSARLITGSRPVHSGLERDLADWKGDPDAVLFPTGFAANLGVLATFGHAGATIFSDELNHASIIDGARSARAKVVVYRHCDLDHLAQLMAANDGPAMVVSDTVFSMDGDLAPLSGLVELCRRREALLVLDEAHEVFESTSSHLDSITDRGIAAGEPAVLRVGTLSKMLGSLGGFVTGVAPMINLLRNRARSYIFTTASTPADVAAARAALAVVRSGEGEELRATLRGHINRLSPGHPSPIVPVVLGSEERALAAAAALLDRGLFVPAIRPPTVPTGTSRLRVTFSAAHTDSQVDELLQALVSLGHPATVR